MKKIYYATGLEKLSKDSNAILASIDYNQGKGYVLKVRAAEIQNGCVGYMFSPEYYNIYYEEKCVLESCIRRGAKAEERANTKAKEIVDSVVEKYIERVANLSGVEPKITNVEEWK